MSKKKQLTWIFTITGLTKDLKSKRCFGYATEFREAQQELLADRCGFTEAGLFHYFVIERFAPGCYAYGEHQSWYQDTGAGIKPIKPPKAANGTINWGMG